MTGDKEYIVSKVRHLKGRAFKALLGKGDSGHTVLVTGKANYVWVRVKYGSSLGAPVQALNRHVPPIHGRMVRVQEIDRAGIKGYEVIDFDDKGTPYYHDDTGHGVLPKHGWTHECSQDTEATDPVNLYTRCWAELRVEPTDPCSLYTYVTHGWYMCEDLGWFAGGNSPLFVPPDAGLRYDLVYIDCSGTIGIETGDVGGEVALIPEPPDFTIPLAAIQLTGSVGCIVEDMILDCRVMPNLKMPAGGARFDDSITPSAVTAGIGSWAGDDEYPSRADHRHNLTEPLRLLDGTANAPSFSFASEPTLGLWRRGAGEVGLDDSLWIGDDLHVVDHGYMLTGTVGQNFQIGGDLTVAGPNSMLLLGGAVVWEDLRTPVTATIKGGSKDPDFTVFKTDGAASQGVFLYWFDKTQEQELYFTIQLPHAWQEGTAIYPHVHWTPAANGGADLFVQWGLEYTWANIDAVFGNTTIITTNTTTSGDNPLVASKHYRSSFAPVSGVGQDISSMLICRIFRDATADDYDDDAGLLEIDFHCLVNMLGSRTESAK